MQLVGMPKADRRAVRDDDRRIAAYHEAGHALVVRRTDPNACVSKVSIVPGATGAGGFCHAAPPERAFSTKKYLRTQMAISLAGRAAEELIFGEDGITTGASNDLEKATHLSRMYVTKYGMGQNLSTRDDAPEECEALLTDIYANALQILGDNVQYLHNLANALLQHETLDEAQVLELT
jgi:cell division protease FtsH